MRKEIEHNKIQHDKIAFLYNKKHPEIYNVYEQNRLKQTVDGIMQILGDSKKINFLDFGAGTGNLSRIFSEKGSQVVACDVSQNSLDNLKKNLPYSHIKTILYDGIKLPFEDDIFDVVATYSVLHHIPDYLFAVKEMIRVAKKGGLIYIDHEANYNKWHSSEHLNENYSMKKQTLWEHIKKLFNTRELFTLDFIKTVVIKIFINKKYQREGDIHVWNDDHIDWKKIKKIIEEKECKIIKEIDYLMYKPKGGEELFEKYKNKCNDTKLIIFKK